MFWTIAIILAVAWGIGMVTAHTMGGFIHLLLIASAMIVMVRVIQRAKPLP